MTKMMDRLTTNIFLVWTFSAIGRGFPVTDRSDVADRIGLSSQDVAINNQDGNPAMVNTRLLDGNPAMANAGLLNGNPEMANQGFLDGNPEMANAGLLNGNPTMANQGFLDGNRAVHNPGQRLFNGAPVPAGGDPEQTDDDLEQYRVEGPDDYQPAMDVYDIRAMHGLCPMVDCIMMDMFLRCPPSEREPSLFTVNGMLCKGCLQCKPKTDDDNRDVNKLPGLLPAADQAIDKLQSFASPDQNVVSVEPEQMENTEDHLTEDEDGSSLVTAKTDDSKHSDVADEMEPSHHVDPEENKLLDDNPERPQEEDPEGKEISSSSTQATSSINPDKSRKEVQKGL